MKLCEWDILRCGRGKGKEPGDGEGRNSKDGEVDIIPLESVRKRGRRLREGEKLKVKGKAH